MLNRCFLHFSLTSKVNWCESLFCWICRSFRSFSSFPPLCLPIRSGSCLNQSQTLPLSRVSRKICSSFERKSLLSRSIFISWAIDCGDLCRGVLRLVGGRVLDWEDLFGV